jgi:carbon storage regulator
MLVLSRHRDEAIVIDGTIVVTVVDIRGDKVRLGIEAPQDIPVHRREVQEAINREGKRAASAGVSLPAAPNEAPSSVAAGTPESAQAEAV